MSESISSFGKTIALAGTLEHYTRQSATTLIKEGRGKVFSSVSSKTEFDAAL